MAHFCEFVVETGGWRSHDEDSADTRFHSQTAAREEKTFRFGAGGHNVRVSSVFLSPLSWCFEVTFHLGVCRCSIDHMTLLEGVIVLEEFCKELAAIAFVKYHTASSPSP